MKNLLRPNRRSIFCILLLAVAPAMAQETGAKKEGDQHSLTWQRKPPLVSRWADGLRLKTPLPEYPRPQMVRDEWMNLNGEWDFLGDGPEPPVLPTSFPEKALVPSATDAVTSCLKRGWNRGWYRKTIDIPESWKGKVVLHFESVGGNSKVYFNSKELGSNSGTYKRFSFEVSDFKAGKNEILVYFDDRDPRIPRGKPGRLSGIWLGVWAEPVPVQYIRSFRQTPDIDAGTLRVEIPDAGSLEGCQVVATALDGGQVVASAEAPAGQDITLKIPNQKLWSPEKPFLYDLTLELRRGNEVVDSVKSYFGMRKIEAGEVDGAPRLLLNNEPYYQAGLLDQTFWPESFVTPPSDEAMKWEIEQAKAMGFNVLRKHFKVEASRWYYWCDVLGMLVWQDLAPQSYFSKRAIETEEDKQFQRNALTDMITQLYNHPSIICWVIFNERVGQFDPFGMTVRARKLDRTRLINTTSHVYPNEFNRKRYNTDFYDGHCYERNLKFYDYDAHIPSTFGEYGGIGYLIKENSIEHDNHWGYGPDASSEEEFLSMYEDLVIQACRMRVPQNLCAIIYTELTDCNDEVNGFITFDRKVVKADVEKVKRINMLFRDPASKPGPLKPLPKRLLQQEEMAPVKGRFVRIELPGSGRVLSLAEVEVFEIGRNFALGQKASASSTEHGGTPERAVDGKTDGNFANKSVTHTATETNPWWEVDLGQTLDIEKIKVHNRTDGAGDRLKNFTLTVLDENRKVVFEKKNVKEAEIIEFSK